ncbi:hypothetical protein JOD27_000024 [Lentzea nigeriaca]|nr:hypothetical protein [Lentzea nigeriaca]
MGAKAGAERKMICVVRHPEVESDRPSEVRTSD